MRLVVETGHATATGVFGRATAQLVTQLEGRKVWKNAQCLRFETTEHNLRTFRDLFPEAMTFDQRPKPPAGSVPPSTGGGQGLASPSGMSLPPGHPGTPPSGPPGQPEKAPSGEAQRWPEGGLGLASFPEMGEREATRLKLASAHGGQPSVHLKAQAGSLFAATPKELAGAAQVHPALWLGDRDLMPPLFRTVPYDDQRDAFMKLRRLRVCALFSEPGTGKTKTAIDLICDKYINWGLRHLVIFSWPKGVHHQWVDEQIPEHIWDNVKVKSWAWEGKKLPVWFGQDSDELKIYSFNIEAMNVERVNAAVVELLKNAGDETMVLIDESQSIKNPSSVRTKKAYYLSKLAGFRMVMTGTPIARDLTDEWSQFKFLDERIIGIRYKVAFQSQFCIMGGFKDKKVIAHRNLDTFARLVHPYIFRATKDQLKLPPKVYDRVVFDLSPRQKDLQSSIKQTFIAQLDSGAILSVDSAAAMMLRLQQIACGYVVDDDGNVQDLEENPRLDALKNLVASVQGKKIIWCRFQRDVQILAKEFGKKAVVHYGPSTALEREMAKSDFINRHDIEFFIATPATAGTGVDGLQHVCSTAIYYSQSFNAIERWQSEERIHRIGTKYTTTYFELIGRGSIDVPIAANLRQKKSFSDFMLDDVRRMIDGL